MAYEDTIRRYRSVYAKLLKLYPTQHYQRFSEGMEQTFTDCLRERTDGALFISALWMFVETSAGIIQLNSSHMLTKRTFIFIVAALSLLLVPFFAMQFQVEGWDWHIPDYMIMAVLLTGVGFALAAATNSAFPIRRRLIGIGAAGLIFLIYVHLAVGIVDSWPFAGS